MSLLEMIPNIHTLSRTDKLRLIQLIAQDLTQSEDQLTLPANQSYPIWSPDTAFAAADTMLKILEAEKGKP